MGRSLDSVMYVLDRPRLNVTLVGARPTREVFQVDGWGQLDVNVFYGAVTGAHKTGEGRVFALGYHDYRDSVLKIDNRMLAARRDDRGSILVGTFGGHYLRIIDSPAGNVDTLVWAALQTGSWGTLAHRAGAFAAEAGWQPRILTALRPWLRVGYAYGSGDGDPDDRTHATFFQVLPTPRVHARFPFYNLMNNGDGFAQLIVRPSRRVTIRADARVLRLANANDLWYQGGGVFQPSTFGYTGRPSGGRTGLTTLYDASGEYAVTALVTIGAYVSHASGDSVPAQIYTDRRDARFGYLEMILRF